MIQRSKKKGILGIYVPPIPMHMPANANIFSAGDKASANGMNKGDPKAIPIISMCHIGHGIEN